MATDHGWLRNIVHVTLIIGLLFQLYEFVIDVSEKDVGVSMSSSWKDGVSYPSVTICPQPDVQQELGNLMSVSSRDWLTFFRHKVYLENG